MQLFFEQLLNGIAMGSIEALISLGLAQVYGILRIPHVAHILTFPTTLPFPQIQIGGITLSSTLVDVF